VDFTRFTGAPVVLGGLRGKPERLHLRQRACWLVRPDTGYKKLDAAPKPGTKFAPNGATVRSSYTTQKGAEVNDKAIEIGRQYRVIGDQAGKTIKVFNIVEDTLLVGGVLFDPETNSMQYTQGFAPADPAWADHAHVHINRNAPEIYREQIGDEVSFDQLHMLTVRARTAMSHFASTDTAPLAVWYRKLFAGPESP
jgi:hypothetical protein